MLCSGMCTYFSTWLPDLTPWIWVTTYGLPGMVSLFKSSNFFSKNVCASILTSFRFTWLLLSCRKPITFCGFEDMYGFSKCSSWKPPVSKVDSDIFHHKALSSPMILWFRKCAIFFLQIMTTKYWRQSCQADVFFLLLELYLSWVSTVMKTDIADFGLKKSVVQNLYEYFHLIMYLSHSFYWIFQRKYTRRAKISGPVCWQKLLIYIDLGENKVV